jgi:peptidoglycan/LPS O-acetylase OafA/YrhL
MHQVGRPQIRLTSIRGVASLIVVFHHAMLLFRVEGLGDTLRLPLQISDHKLLVQQVLLIAFNGQAAVLLFFVLSGCVLSLSLQSASVRTTPTIIGFYIKRLFRLFPTLWFAVLVSLLLLPYNRGAHNDQIATEWMQLANSRSPSLLQVGRHLVGVDSFLDQPIWSLFIELFYSALLPAIFLLTCQLKRTIAMLTFAAFALFSPMPVFRDLHYYLLAFVIGSAIANMATPPRRLGPVSVTTLLAVASLFLLGARRILDPLNVPLSVVIWIETWSAAAIIYLVQFTGVARRLLEHRALGFVGEISYSIYLLHFPLIFVVAGWFEGCAGGDFIATHPISADCIVGGVTAVITIPIAAAASRWIERPFQKLGRTLASRVQIRFALVSV